MTQNERTSEFLACAHAIESWDLVELRRLWGLPADASLEAIAALVARLWHLERNVPEAFAPVIRSSPMAESLQRSAAFRKVEKQLPAVYAFLQADQMETAERHLR